MFVTGYGANRRSRLATHPDVRKLAFTGSVPTGISVASAAVRDRQKHKPRTRRQIADRRLRRCRHRASRRMGDVRDLLEPGQVCSATSRMIVQNGIGRSSSNGSQRKPRRSRSATAWRLALCSGLSSVSSNTKRCLATSTSARARRRLLRADPGPRNSTKDTSWSRQSSPMSRRRRAYGKRKFFGPVLAVTTFGTEDEAVALANDSEFGLAAAVMSGDHKRAERVRGFVRSRHRLDQLLAAELPRTPLGRRQKSGVGRELGTWGLNNFLEAEADHDLSDARSLGLVSEMITL